MSKKNKRYSKDDLITEISRDVQIKREVVKIILESFINIAIREIVTKGDFLLKDLFSVKTAKWKGYEAGNGQTVPDHTRLRIKISDKVRRLYKYQQKAKAPINQHNWQTALSFYDQKAQEEKNNNNKTTVDDYLDQLINDDETRY